MTINRISKIVPNLARAPELLRCARLCSDWRKPAMAYLGIHSPEYPFKFRMRDGDTLILDRFEDLATAWLVFIRQDYAVDASSRVIIDAGANIGAFSLYAARVAPAARILALEPFPTTFERLQMHVRGSTMGERITCRRWALGQADGRRIMDATPMASQFRSLRHDDSLETGVHVEAVTLASLWDRERLDRVELLKLDIEGSEYELIEATPSHLLHQIDAIEMEYHPNGSSSDLFRRLCAAGFVLVRDDPALTPGYGLAVFRLKTAKPALQ